MPEACFIDYKGVKYIFQNVNDEEPRSFIKRSWIIVKNTGRIQKKEMLDMLSHAWVNVHYKQMTYDRDIMEMIDLLVV